MQRRRYLVLAVAGLSGCVSASDGSGPRNPPSTPEGGGPIEPQRRLRIVDGEPREGEDGALVLVVTVENRGDSRRSDTLVGVVTVDTEDGSTEYEASREVSLDGNSESEVELVFDVDYEAWAGSGSLAYGWEGEL